MSSVRRVLTPLAIALLLIALPWTATASSNEVRSGEGVPSAAISIITGDSSVIIGVTISGLAADNVYQYHIKVYRVDAHFKHLTVSGNISTSDYDGDGYGDDVYVNESWMPTQDGPYTVWAFIYGMDGSPITNSNTTFGWGDVEGNSAPAAVSVSVSPNQEYYDFVGDYEKQKNVSVTFGSENLETGATYSLEYKMFELDEDGHADNDVRLFSMTTITTSAHYNMSALGNAIEGGWSNDTTYRLEVKLWLIYEDGPLAAADEFEFTVGEAPPEPQELLELELSCDLNEDNVWYMLLDDDDTDHMLYCYLYNPNSVAIKATTMLTYSDTRPAGIDSSPLWPQEYTLNANESQSKVFSFDWGESERFELNGTMTLTFNFQESEQTFWIGGNVTYSIDFVIENETVTIPEIYGCTNPTADNYDPDANIDDGSCLYETPEDDHDGDGLGDDEDVDDDGDGWTDVDEWECGTDPLNNTDVPLDNDGNGVCDVKEPLIVLIFADKNGGIAPLDVSFAASITGGQGPYTIEWEIGTSLFESPEIDYQFPSGDHVVVLSVVDVNGQTATDLMEFTVTEPIFPLSGYIAHSLQVNSTEENMTGAMEFTGVANGGLAPYSFQWSFEWLDSEDSFLFGDKQQKVIHTATGEVVMQDFENDGNYTVTLTIIDSEGSIHNAEVNIEIVEPSDDDDALILKPEPDEEGEEQIEELGILIASTGGLGLLMLFGLAGRKRKDDLLEKLRAQNAEGWSTEENALWDTDLGRFD